MASFTYDQLVSGPGFMLDYVAFGGATRESFAKYFELPPAAGPFAVSGIGFQPECVIIFGAIHLLNETSERLRTHFGVATSPAASDQWCMEMSGADNVSTKVRIRSFTSNKVVKRWAQATATVDFDAALLSFDADGFTLNIIDPPGANTPMVALCLRGGGQYACGVANAPAAGGAQSIPVGFAADLLLLGSVGTVNDSRDPTAHGFSVGAADASRQAMHWMGANDHPNPNTASLGGPGAVLSVCEAEGPVAGYGVANILAQAVFDGFVGTDAELDWVESDGNAYRFGWFACENAATDRFSSIGDAGGLAVVTTPVEPRALLGYCQSMLAAQEIIGPSDPSFVAGASIQISCADEFCTTIPQHEWGAGSADADAPTAGVQQTTSDLNNSIFGCHAHFSSPGFGFGHQSSQHQCNIVALDFTLEEFALVAMNWRSAARMGVGRRVLVGDG